MLPRFYVPDLDPAAPKTPLPADEALHLTRVLRLGEGSRIAIFDGRGHEFAARVAAASRDRVQVDLLEAIVPVPEPSSVVLAMGLLGLVGWRERRRMRHARSVERLARG